MRVGKGQVWTFGCSHQGQLGLGEHPPTDRMRPALVEPLKDVTITSVVAGAIHTCAVTGRSLVVLRVVCMVHIVSCLWFEFLGSLCLRSAASSQERCGAARFLSIVSPKLCLFLLGPSALSVPLYP